MNRLLLCGTAILALATAGCQAQSSSATPAGPGVQSRVRGDLQCAPNKNNCFYFLPSTVTDPGFGNSVSSTAYTSPISDTDTPAQIKQSGTCYGYHWQYSSSVDPNYTVGPNGNSLLWSVTVTLKQTGKNPTGPSAGSTCVLVFANSAGKGNLVIKTPN
jgi:hypothetical protein